MKDKNVFPHCYGDCQIVKIFGVSECDYICPKSTLKNMNRMLGEFDVWFKPCARCGYDTGRATKKSEARCWKCGNQIYRDYSERALKKTKEKCPCCDGTGLCEDINGNEGSCATCLGNGYY